MILYLKQYTVVLIVLVIVTMLEFLPRIALGFDLELSNLLQRSLTAQGITFHLETKVTSVRVENGRVTAVATKGSEELKFDADKVYRMIDGRESVKGHGGTDMPVWGDAFKRSVEGYSEKAVKARIRTSSRECRSAGGS